MEGLSVELVPLEELTPHPLNPRRHRPEQVEFIMRSIEHAGWTNPIITNGEKVILAGHGRRMAAERLGLKRVPCIIRSDWDENTQLAYLLNDNLVSDKAGWEAPKLTIALEHLQMAGHDLGNLAMTEQELRHALIGPNAGKSDENQIPEAPLKVLTQAGELWVLGDKHRLVCGDATNATVVSRLFDGKEPNLMVSDPPYGVSYDPAWRNKVKRADGTLVGARAVGKVANDDRADWREAWKLFPGAAAYIWHAGLHATEVAASLLAAGFEVRSQIIWVKQHFLIGRGHYHWQHEPCWYVARKGKSANWKGGRKESTVWEISNAGGYGGNNEDMVTGHGTQKPVECMRRPIENSSAKGDLIYDPFMGSGTTIIAAEQSGRIALGCEIDPVYVHMAIARWVAFTGGEARELVSGETWSERVKRGAPPESEEI